MGSDYRVEVTKEWGFGVGKDLRIVMDGPNHFGGKRVEVKCTIKV